MTRTFVKGLAAAGVAASLLLATTASAFPAGKPKGTPATPKVVKPVVFRNQGVTLASGLTPKAALQRAHNVVKYRVTTPHYLPKDFALVLITVYPYIPDMTLLSDTQTFYKAHSRSVKDFEVDHQLGAPYVYNFPLASTTARVGSYTATVAEEKGTNAKTHKTVDLLFVYWYDTHSKLATEVTADLKSSGLTRADVLRIANSVS